MAETGNHRKHLFSWENLATTDTAIAKRFYQRLFGWEVTYIPTGDYGTHCFFTLDGKDICSFSEIPDFQRKHFSTQWVPYISVENMEDLVHKAQNAGGTVLVPISPAVDAGQTAMIKDPTDAIFAIWRPRQQDTDIHRSPPGAACFHELVTNNMDLAGMFYAQVFSWSPRAENFGDIKYIMFNIGNVNVGSMMGVPKQNVHPRWITYWCVQDCEKSLRKAIALGGTPCNTVEIIKRKGRYATLIDPLGALFGIMQPEK
ncbi:MAG: hypothetical protein A2X86_13800 [Bdellovibrionales bacterium GWA2_49_15]|nr:MAG: hypothetical protein A2X86_13800 [Bdellovibrionales bacterium GWA2_49_15]HAZ13601.1 hypothetical protein [Bdellovibrionales bacterium]